MSIVAHGFTALRYVYTRREYYVERRLSRLRNCGGKNEDSTSCAVRRALKTARRGGHRPRPQGPPSSLAAGHPRDARDEARWHSCQTRSLGREQRARPPRPGARHPARKPQKNSYCRARVCAVCRRETGPDALRRTRAPNRIVRARQFRLKTQLSAHVAAHRPVLRSTDLSACGSFSRDRYHQPSSFATAACPCALGVLLCPCRPAHRPSRRRRLRHHR